MHPSAPPRPVSRYQIIGGHSDGVKLPDLTRLFVEVTYQTWLCAKQAAAVS